MCSLHSQVKMYVWKVRLIFIATVTSNAIWTGLFLRPLTNLNKTRQRLWQPHPETEVMKPLSRTRLRQSSTFMSQDNLGVKILKWCNTAKLKTTSKQHQPLNQDQKPVFKQAIHRSVTRHHSLFSHVCHISTDKSVSQVIQLSAETGTLELLPSTGCIYWVIHGSNKYRKTLAYLEEMLSLSAFTINRGGYYNPQLVKLSSEWVAIMLNLHASVFSMQLSGNVWC